MRRKETGPVLICRAIAGTYVVVLAWDFRPGQEAKKEGLLGFAIERIESDAGTVTERYFLRGIKRFRNKDDGLPPGALVSTAAHPIQSFLKGFDALLAVARAEEWKHALSWATGRPASAG